MWEGCVVVWTGKREGDGVQERKTTDALLVSTTSPYLLGWASVSEKSAEVVAPEKVRMPCRIETAAKAGLVPKPNTLMELSKKSE